MASRRLFGRHIVSFRRNNSYSEGLKSWVALPILVTEFNVAGLFLILGIIVVLAISGIRGRGTGRGRGRGAGRDRGRGVGRDLVYGRVDGQIASTSRNNENDDTSSTDSDKDTSSIHEQRGRGPSLGEFGKPPNPPRPIRIIKNSICDEKATRTVLAMLRCRWPVDCATYGQAKKKTCGQFLKSMMREFHTYYVYSNVTNNEGDKAVLTHIEMTMKRELSIEYKKAVQNAKTNGLPMEQQGPEYFSVDVWNTFCAYWKSPKFLKRSAANTLNRSKNRIPHSTGPKSFALVEEEYTEKNNAPPTLAQLWEFTHQDKKTHEFTSEEVRAVSDRYNAILEERSMTQDVNTPPIEWWLEATGMKKNRILGMPRISVNEVISNPYDMQDARNNQTSDNPSSSVNHLSSEKFFKTVQSTLLAMTQNTTNESVPIMENNQHHGVVSRELFQEIVAALRIIFTKVEQEMQVQIAHPGGDIALHIDEESEVMPTS